MESNPKLWTKDETPKSFYNPLTKPIVVDYRNDANEVSPITIPPISVQTHPTYLADHLIKHLVDAIILDRNLGYITPDERKEIQTEVETI